jgi:PAS domain S-box-containing protein
MNPEMVSDRSANPLFLAGGSHHHLVQFYDGDQQSLTKNVAQFLAEGIERGEGVLVIATPPHAEAFLRQLKRMRVDPDRAEFEGKMVILDAERTLAKFFVNGRLDQDLFESTVQVARSRLAPSNGLRAYGEMVGILWKDGRYDTAIQLEAFWNDFLRGTGCKLFCAYPIDIFGPEFNAPETDCILRSHTRLISAGTEVDLAGVMDRSMREVLGPATAQVKDSMLGANGFAGVALPDGERAIRWLYAHLPDRAVDIVARAQHHYSIGRRFRALVENSSDAISLLGVDGVATYASPSASQVLGYHAKELVGADFFALIHPEDHEEYRCVFEAAVAKPCWPIQVEVRLRQKDGTWRWIESTHTNLLNDPDLQAIVVNSRDVSDRKAAEKRSHLDAEKLQHAYRDLEAFAYAATHDLRDPLRSVCAFTELLTENARLEPETRQYADFIIDGVKRMSALLDALMSWDRIKAPEPLRQIDLGDAARQAVINLSQAISESSAVVHIGRMPIVGACEGHMVQLFQNLIGNAIKYRTSAPPEIRIFTEWQGAEFTVIVKDNGMGVAPEYREQIFGLFKRLHADEVPGTGIGLALCKRIVEEMGGRIWVDSAPHEGSAFCFTLPYR